MSREAFDRRFVRRKEEINFSEEIRRLTESPPQLPEWVEKIPCLGPDKIPDETNFWSFSDSEDFPRKVIQALKSVGIDSFEERTTVLDAIDAAALPPTIKGIHVRPLGNDDALLRVGDVRGLSIKELEQIDSIRSYLHGAIILKKLFGDIH